MANSGNKYNLKIGIVFDDSLDKPDGVQQYILSVGRWLQAEGHEVHYLVGETKRIDIPRVHSLSRNVGVTFNGNRLSIPLPSNKKLIKRLHKDEHFDVLHVQMPYSPWLAHRIIMAAPVGTAVFGTFHIVAYSRLVRAGTKLLALWTGQSLRKYHQIVSVSSAAQQYAEDTYGIQTDVLPNVFDYPRFSSAKAALPALKNKKRILFLGRLVERKGCQYLLQAIRMLHEQGLDNFEAIICGKGHLLPSLQQYAKKYQLPVTFTGFVSENDKPGYYASADIAVFPSIGGESFGIVLIEAMASGSAAVIGANNSGYASVLHVRQDLQFDSADAKAIADKLHLLLSDEGVRQAAADWGAAYSKQFDVSVVGTQLLSKYRDSIDACAKQMRSR